MDGRPSGVGQNEELEGGTANTGCDVGQCCQSSVVGWESASAPDYSRSKSATKVTSSVELKNHDSHRQLYALPLAPDTDENILTAVD